MKLLAAATAAMLLVVGLFLVNRYWIAPAMKTLATGSASHPQAPPFSLTDITGRPLKLSDYRGKVVMLDFWATWCGPCRAEIPRFVQLQRRYGEQGLAIIGISMDNSAAPVVEFYNQFRMNYPVALGNDRLGESYGGVLGLPITLVIGREGAIYAKHVGATDIGVLETEIKQLLAPGAGSEAASFR